MNLVAALFALIVVQWTARPADEEHAYGHEKADYFAAGVEGGLILIAALTIIAAAVYRLMNPVELSQIGPGVMVALVASVINFGVARLMISAGREENSATVLADGKHLMTDVWTSIGVVLAVVAVVVTGWERLDPIIALLVAMNIVRIGFSLLRSSTGGLMDRALSADELAAIDPCSTIIDTITSTFTRCAPGARAIAHSSPCTCWCRARGASSKAMTSSNCSNATCVKTTAR